MIENQKRDRRLTGVIAIIATTIFILLQNNATHVLFGEQKVPPSAQTEETDLSVAEPVRIPSSTSTESIRLIQSDETETEHRSTMTQNETDTGVIDEKKYDISTPCSDFSEISRPDSYLFLSYSHDSTSGYITPFGVPHEEEICTKVAGSDGSTFHQIEGEYSADKNHVYYWTFNKNVDNPIIIEGADPLTFQVFSIQHAEYDTGSSWTNLLFRDASHLYYGGSMIRSANPDTIKPLKRGINNASSSSIFSTGYYIDNIFVYYFSPTDFGKIEGADIDSFEFLKNGYARDKNHVYKGTKIVPDANPETYIPQQTPPPCTEC